MEPSVAIVTGASQGIGRVTAVRLARDFSALVLVARDRANLEGTTEAVKSAGAKALAIDRDLAQPAAAQTVADQALAAFGRIDALLNIAGAVPQIDLFDMTDAQWEAGLALKLHGARRLTIAAWPALKAANGAVVLMSGNSAQFPKAPYAAVGTINAAMVLLSEARPRLPFPVRIRAAPQVKTARRSASPGPQRPGVTAGVKPVNVIQQIEAEHAAQLPGAKMPAFQPGDTVVVNVKVAEGERTRVQAYEGVCIARSGQGLNENFTVRKISYGEGVERVFPIYSPMIDSVKVLRRGKVRRAKLYYLRDRRGKSARIAERTDTSPAAKAAAKE